MDARETAAYAAGLFDGEGWAVIGVERAKVDGHSDFHHAGMYVTQRARHREALDRLHAAYGGALTVRDTKIKTRETWAEQADWHIHKRPEIEAFCRAIQPYVLVKAAQVAIMLEYVTDFIVSPVRRDDLGRIHGMSLSLEEIERRERLRLALKVVNAKGPDHLIKIVKPSTPPRHVDHLVKPLEANHSTLQRGEMRYNAKMTDDKVRAIRAEYDAGGITMEALALRYGVTAPAIRHIVRRLSWQHVT